MPWLIEVSNRTRYWSWLCQLSGHSFVMTGLYNRSTPMPWLCYSRASAWPQLCNFSPAHLSISTGWLDSVVLTLGLARATGGEDTALEGAAVRTHLGNSTHRLNNLRTHLWYSNGRKVVDRKRMSIHGNVGTGPKNKYLENIHQYSNTCNSSTLHYIVLEKWNWVNK